MKAKTQIQNLLFNILDNSDFYLPIILILNFDVFRNSKPIPFSKVSSQRFLSFQKLFRYLMFRKGLEAFTVVETDLSPNLELLS